MKLTLQQIAGVTGGIILKGSPELLVRGLATDTRAITGGEVFLALRGDRFDGEAFAVAALEKGAAGVIVRGGNELCAVSSPDQFVLQVNDTEVALADVARAWRSIVNPRLVAITGSAGKTTTKDMLAHICSGVRRTHATKGNYNNHIGLPLTLLDMPEDCEVAVVEAGMNHSGELRHLASICHPNIAVVTNIGSAHLGNFKDEEEIARAKCELISSLPDRGVAVVNSDCSWTARHSEFCRMPDRVLQFGMRLDADVRADQIGSVHPCGYHFQIVVGSERFPARLNVFGRCQISNALAATAAALELGIPGHIIADRLTTFRAPAMRCEVERRDGFMIIHDYYNASPEAVIGSIRSMRDMDEGERRVLLLGDMLELGDESIALHRRVGEVAAEERFNLVVTVGEFAAEAATAVRLAGVPSEHFATSKEAGQWLAPELRQSDVLLVKGSRGMKMELAVAELSRVHQSGEGIANRV